MRPVFRAGLAVAAGAVVALAARTLLRPVVQLKVGGLMRPGQLSIPLGKPPRSPWAWLEIGPDERVHFRSPKAELGQGTQTGLAQLLAEELEVDLERVVVHQPDTAVGFDPRLLLTIAGTSVNGLSRPLREAGAALREALRAEAAARLGCEREAVVAERGRCFVRDDPARSLSYGELAAGKQGAWAPPAALAPPALKEPEEYRLVGRSVPRLDLPEKVTGRAVFGFDVRRPGMLYGAVARPPREGARLRGVRGVAAVEARPGVVKVVVGRGFAGVVAERRRQAYAALDRLDLEWTGGTTVGQAEVRDGVTAPERGGAVVDRAGDAPRHLGRGRPVRAEYRSTMFVPLPFEPSVAVADVRPEGVTVHAPSQNPPMVRGAVARALGRPKRDVRIVSPYAGGSFARKHIGEAAPEAARLSAAVGRPVHVGRSLAEDLRHGHVRPPSHHVMRGSLDPDGRALAVEHRLALAECFPTFPPFSLAPKLTGVDVGALFGVYVTYGGIPHRRSVFRHAPIPVPTSMSRAPGLHPNVFAVESFVDELAHQAGADPLAFRLAHLGTDDLGRRLRLVLGAAAGRAGWGTQAPAGRARGLACCAYGDLAAAEVAEVSVEDGRIRVHRVTCALDLGPAVNPGAARAQVEGGVAMGLSWALREEIRLDRGTRAETGLNDYPLLTLKEMPTVDTLLLDDGPRLVGPSEIPIGPVAAAVANAVFALTGARLRELPLRMPGVVRGG